MAEEVLKIFNTLSSSDRSDALQKLVNTLNLEERQLLSTAISRRNDFVAALPFELVVQVFNHLDFFAPWPLQRVCKRWHKLLSSEEFFCSAVNRWHNHDPADSARSVAEVANDSTVSKLRNIQAHRLRRPFTTAVLNGVGMEPEGSGFLISGKNIALNGKRIAYVSGHRAQGHTLIIRDMIDGDVRTLRGEAREGIFSHVLTSSLVAFTSYDGFLYVVRFSQDSWEEPSRIQLPSARARGIGGHGDVVALVFDRAGSASLSEVVLYNARTKKMSSLSIENECEVLEGQVLKLNSCGVIVDSDKEVVDLFSLTLRNGVQLMHVRLSFDGEIVCCDWKNEAIGYWRESKFAMDNPTPTGFRNQYRIQIKQLAKQKLKFHILFDTARGKFHDNNLVHSEGILPDESGMGVLWKSQVHRPSSRHKSWSESVVLMNDTFMASLETRNDLPLPGASRIRVLCYDENVHMHNAERTGLWPDESYETDGDGLVLRN